MTAPRNDTLTHTEVALRFDEARVALVHGRVEVSVRHRGSRVWTTAVLPLDGAETLFTRGAEIVRHGRAQEPEAF